MIPEPIDDAILQNYVLGRLDEPARDDIEAWLLATPDAPALVDAIELELAERYLDGDLPEPDRADFARLLRERPALTGRLALVQGLRDRARGAAPARPLAFAKPARPRLIQSSWVPATLAAGLILAGGLAVRLQVERTRLESEVHRLEARAAAPAPPPVVSSLQTPSAARVVAATLSAGIVRSANTTIITTTPDTDLMRLALRVPAGTVPMRATVVDGDLIERLRLGPLVPADPQATQVTLDVPTSGVPPGDYTITLRPDDGRTSPTLTYSFRVSSTR
jgi:anti-sigma factor RsiW